MESAATTTRHQHVFSGFEPLTPTASSGTPPEAHAWPLWQRVLFRFFFGYLLLQISPWDMFRPIPGVPWVLQLYDGLVGWAVRAGNAHVFHVRETLIPVNGSGDTSFAWAQLWLFLSLAVVACVVWSIFDRKRQSYDRLGFWLRMIVRYYIAAAALSYGIIKIFALQMSFPSTSLLATPLGDLLPMRFSWLFIGYSTKYQVFSGVMETVAGLLLLYRRTVTLGLLAATGAFLNVVMINMSYDVPVKIFASHLLFACFFLLALDAKRLFTFLVLNRPAPGTTAYEPNFERRWQKWGSVAVKVFIVVQVLVMPFTQSWRRYDMAKSPAPEGPLRTGVYDVRQFVVGTGTSATIADSLRWKDVIIDSRASGSVNTHDPVFWQRYGRGYFRYRADPVARTLAVWKTSAIPGDSTFLFNMRYEVPDTSSIRLHTVIRGDSVHVELVRVPRHFQLTERQFHWLSEYNR